MSQPDFYVILGVERAATVAQLKRAYKRLARRYHPDINPGDQEAEAFYRLVTEAYETLCDPDRRREYDLHGSRPATTPLASVEFQGFDFSSADRSAGMSVTFEELFADVLQDAVRRHAPADPEPVPGSDLHGEVALTFEEAVTGAERRLHVTRLETCAACAGRGRRRAVESGCTACRGAGATRWRRGHMVFSKTCAACRGTGRLPHRPCAACGEQGVVPHDQEITIQVPAGVRDGARLRVQGQGNAGRAGGRPGDLYLMTTVADHPFLRRDGDDLHLTLPVAIHEAALGADVEVPTLEGRVRLHVPPGTQSGRQFRLPAQGVPSPQRGTRGDLVVSVTLVLPAVVDERAKQLLREFGRIHSGDPRKEVFGE